MTRAEAPEAGRARPYHHGGLREALIEATHRLIAERGVEGFTLADACRAAGVSTAAPYRHFADRNDLIRAVVARGFERLEVMMRARAAPFEAGSIERIIADGQAYVAFAIQEPALFRLMFGRSPELKSSPEVNTHGEACFAALLESVRALQQQRGLQDVSVLDVALPLWSLVHGFASLEIDGAFARKVEKVDLDHLIDQTTRRFFAGFVLQRGPVDAEQARGPIRIGLPSDPEPC